MADYLASPLIAAVDATFRLLRKSGYLVEATYLTDRVKAASRIMRPGSPWRSSLNKPRYRHRALLSIDIAHIDDPGSFIDEHRTSRLIQDAELLATDSVRRELGPPPASVVDGVVEVAARLASLDQYWAAISVGILANVMDPRSASEPDLAVDRICDVDILRLNESAVKGTNVPRTAARLLSRGYFAECAALLAGAAGLPNPTEPTLRQAWTAVRRTLLFGPPGDMFADDLFVEMTPQWSKPSRIQGLAYAPKPTATPATASSPTTPASPPAEPRQVNAWIEGDPLPLVQGKHYVLGIDIGAARADALSSVMFREPDWQDRESVDILVLISGSGFEAEIRARPIELPRRGKSDTARFDITVNAEAVLLRISLFLKPEMCLLEEFEVPMEVAPARDAA